MFQGRHLIKPSQASWHFCPIERAPAERHWDSSTLRFSLSLSLAHSVFIFPPSHPQFRFNYSLVCMCACVYGATALQHIVSHINTDKQSNRSILAIQALYTHTQYTVQRRNHSNGIKLGHTNLCMHGEKRASQVRLQQVLFKLSHSVSICLYVSDLSRSVSQARIFFFLLTDFSLMCMSLCVQCTNAVPRSFSKQNKRPNE